MGVRKTRASGGAEKKSPRKRRRATRLAKDVRPTALDIHIEVDPAISKRYRGQLGATLQIGKRRTSIELHACEIRTSRASIRIAGRQRRGRIVAHPERETIEICFDEPLPAGHGRLELAFSGRLRDDLTGLYAAEAEERHYAVSQLAPTHARRFFPCFDEPAFKARYRLAVTTGAKNVVLSNSPIESEEALDDERKTVRFEATPVLSSYLLALAVGEFAQSAPVLCNGTEIRVWSTPNRAGLADFALEVAHECLTRLEHYFGIPHPYAKLDLLAVPNFEFGAMENPGAVFFRETLLLLDPQHATLDEKKRAAEVICHEIAHMWYGNLVTMTWWDDLWLNEAFATWMAFRVVDQWQPNWRMWQKFEHGRAAAFEEDALRHTHAVYAPVRDAVEAVENFDVITYEKGAALIRMLESNLGEDTFREGVRLYMHRHRESNTVAADLWAALAEVSDRPVEAIMRPWLEQPGFPLLRIRRREREGRAVIELCQQRMHLHSPARSGNREQPSPHWPIPFAGRIGTGQSGESRIVRHLLRRKREFIPAHGADLTFIYGNADEGGFYRPLHTSEELRDLIVALPELPALERQALVGHEWALVRAGHAPLADLLDLCAVLGDDPDPDVLASVHQPLHSLAKRLTPDAAPKSEARLRAWVEVYFGAQMDELGFDPDSEETESMRMRRAQILSIAGLVGEASSLIDEASNRCPAYLEDRHALDTELAPIVLSIAASRGGVELHERLLAALRNAHTPQEERRFLLALADFRDPRAIRRTLALCNSAAVAMQDVVLLLQRLLENRHASQATWEYIKKHQKALWRRIPPQLGGRLILATPALLSRTHRREVASFFRAHPLPASERALRQALETFDWYARFRNWAGPQIKSYLEG